MVWTPECLSLKGTYKKSLVEQTKPLYGPVGPPGWKPAWCYLPFSARVPSRIFLIDGHLAGACPLVVTESYSCIVRVYHTLWKTSLYTEPNRLSHFPFVGHNSLRGVILRVLDPYSSRQLSCTGFSPRLNLLRPLKSALRGQGLQAICVCTS